MEQSLPAATDKSRETDWARVPAGAHTASTQPVTDTADTLAQFADATIAGTRRTGGTPIRLGPAPAGRDRLDDSRLGTESTLLICCPTVVRGTSPQRPSPA